MPFDTPTTNMILDWAIGRRQSLPVHDKVFLGLCSNDPEADGGTFNELSGNGYSRVLIHQYNETYPGLITASANRVVSNIKQIGFTKATGGAWAQAKGYGLFTTETGGTPFFYTALGKAVDTAEGAVFLFDPGELKIACQTTDVEIE